MAKKDLKKTEHAAERHEIAEDIVAIRNLKFFSQEKKDELIQSLLYKKELTQACPFPQHKGYVELWKNLKDNPEMRKQMRENIRISADGKIEMIKMKKKFSILTAEHNGHSIFKGEHEDQDGKKGVAGVTYLTDRAAEKVCEEQNKKLLNNRGEVEQFFSYFPGESTSEKIFNFVKLFGLEKAGYWNLNFKTWNNVGSVGYAILSRGDESVLGYGATWNNGGAGMRGNNLSCPSPFIACEDCSA